jgi:acetyltransferase-like isoleucine patch superfamily enzyme
VTIEAKEEATSAVPAPDAPPPAPLFVRIIRRLIADFSGSRPTLLLVQLALSFVPRMAFGWLRPAVYRAVGIRIGSKTRIYGKMNIEGAGGIVANVTIGAECMLTTPVYLNASGEIRIGDRVTIGHHVVVITDNHNMDNPWKRGGDRYTAPVVIEDGVWVGARATILPGVTLGRGCVVAAGALVARDVPPHTLVGGVPAKHIKDLNTIYPNAAINDAQT